MIIKAITLHQPWAVLVGVHKHHETRSWNTSYRGKLAIHAAKKQKDTDAWLLKLEDLLPKLDIVYGSVIAIADLVDCVKMTDQFIRQQSLTEIRCGLWQIDRYAWRLENVKALDQPIPTKGYQGLWNWDWDCGDCL